MKSGLLILWRHINTNLHSIDFCSPFQHFFSHFFLDFCTLYFFLVMVTSVMEQTTHIHCCKTAVIVLHSLIVWDNNSWQSRDGLYLPHNVWGLGGGSFKYLSTIIIWRLLHSRGWYLGWFDPKAGLSWEY